MVADANVAPPVRSHEMHGGALTVVSVTVARSVAEPASVSTVVRSSTAESAGVAPSVPTVVGATNATSAIHYVLSGIVLVSASVLLSGLKPVPVVPPKSSSVVPKMCSTTTSKFCLACLATRV